MPRETDPARLAMLRKILGDTASNVVVLSRRAYQGSDEPDDLGLDRVLPAKLQPLEKKRQLVRALLAHLKNGGSVSRTDYLGDEVRGDPATNYEFRIEAWTHRLYVKCQLMDDDQDDPTLIVKCVKRQN